MSLPPLAASKDELLADLQAAGGRLANALMPLMSTPDARDGADGWTVREIVSHLIGPADGGAGSLIQQVLTQNNPSISIQAHDSFMSPERAAAPLPSLVEQLRQQGRGAHVAISGLSDEQLNRTMRLTIEGSGFPTMDLTLLQFLSLGTRMHMSSHAEQLEKIAAS